MIQAAKSAPSIQRRLLWFLLPPLAVLMLVGVYANYRAATAFVESAYDERLGDAATGLAGSVLKEGQRLRVDASTVPTTAHHADHLVDLRYAIVSSRGELLAGNRDVPVAAASVAANPTFADAVVSGERLRVASYRVNIGGDVAIISVAESAAQRAVPGRFILASTWLMDFIQLDVTLLIVWLGVHFGLKPLLSLRRQIEAGSPRALKHLDATTVPGEVKPLVEALNLLFDVLAEAARSQRRFVADTAHQLRTPITGLLGNLELLMKEPAAAAQRPRLQALHTGMENLARSANQLLALARADPSTSFAEQFDTVDLRALAGRIVEINVDRALNGGLDLGVEAGAVAVRGNVRLLEDLLGNLVDNAIHYTPRGGHVTVRAGLCDGRPYLEVEDDGPGIAEDQRGRVRERFYRIPGSSGHGCGLGLAIVSEIAEAHGAQFRLESGTASTGIRARVLFRSPLV
ncbi:MAG TPA: sensor histidine kinase [Steroidobacteraceae bacterium]|jgi:two-component system sensor histidine kinase TctE|nr:sensor histidine kinase [Steroidobacteraceae bacterium]